MAIQFTTNLEQYTTTQRATKAKHFVDFASKKKLVDSQILSEQETEFVNSIKNIFTLSVHKDLRYVAATLYKASAEKKYSFLVIDVHAKLVAEVDSIKTAKAEILELVKTSQVEESATDETATEPVEVAPSKKSKKSAA